MLGQNKQMDAEQVLALPRVPNQVKDHYRLFKEQLSALPNVTTVGRTSRGASGNPQPFDLLPGVVVRASTWQATDLAGRQVQDEGVEPDLPVDVEPRTYAERDAEFEQALELLREE